MASRSTFDRAAPATGLPSLNLRPYAVTGSGRACLTLPLVPSTTASRPSLVRWIFGST
jgi:hypothetical protein